MDGKIIVVEGIDGSGKDTAIAILKETLDEYNVKYSVYKFPTDKTIYGKIIKDILTKGLNIDPRELAFLFAADRIPFYDRIRKDKEDGKIIILNRWIYSNAAYQGWNISNKLNLTLEDSILYVLSLEPMGIGAPSIDYVLYIYVDFETAVRRLEERGKFTNYDKDKLLLMGAKKAYDYMYSRFKDKDLYGAKWIKIDNNGNLDYLKKQIIEFAKNYILL